uniref:DNA-directed RNA polymerase subunit beta'' n=1 Tax=Pseudotaxus chienii TaxID=89481 RepID=A0A481XGI2_9CONI|nr:RNA polymerase beta subunit-2 [Pseudotaxus chienii]
MTETNCFEVPFPFEVPFYNKVMNKTAMKQLISKFVNKFGMVYTSHILDQLKTSGFQQATDAAISLGIDDLLTTPSKAWLIQDAQQQGFASEKHHDYGNVHAVEKLRQLIEIWHATSEYLRREMNPNFRMTDPLNPVHMMSFSGARGSTSQVHQLVGMRGLMSDPHGKIVDLPIQGNFREGLSLTEYIISCYGARKGVVDTSIRTADAGYLTRRLVEVVQHIVVRKTDCGTIQGLFVSLIQDREVIKNKIVLQTQTLIGRVLADDIYINGRCIATRNQDIGIKLANQLQNLQAQPIYIRTPFTCKSISWICQLCYGRSTTHSNLIELGEAVGIIAGQSIGEPGTQLTLRTFHTGGVFTGDIAEHIRAPFTGKIEFNENLVCPTRTRHGHPAYICHNSLCVIIDSQDQIQNLTIPPESLLFIQNHQLVESEQVIAEVRAKTSPFKEKVEKHIYSDLTGEMHRSIPMSNFIFKTTHLWVLSGGMYKSIVVPFYTFLKDQDQVDIPSLLLGKHQSFSNYSVDQVKYESVYSNFSERERKIFSYPENDQIISNKLDQNNPFYSNDKNQLLSKGTIRSLPNKNEKGESFVVLSPSDFLQIVLVNDSKGFNTVKKLIRKDPIIQIMESSGLLGHLHSIANRFPYSHFITHNKVLLKNRSISGNYSNILQIPKCYFLDEKMVIYKFDSCRNIISNLVNLNLYSSSSYFCKKKIPVVSLGQFICESVWISEDEPLHASGQIIAVHEESLVIRLAKPYLGTRGATLHGDYGKIISEGNTLITLLYERLKSDDIIQGLPKVEQLSEARSTTSISKNRKKNFQKLNKHLARFLGNFWGSFISVRITMEHSQIQLVNQIQRVYRSQGVQISDKHIEIIVRQMTSKVLIVDVDNSENVNLENGLGNVFLPGELVGLSQAQRMDRALEKPINYRTILLGITTASLNTQSFLSEASFQETARVLAKSALRGRIDWLKGLKENVILGGMIPVGTGFNHLGKQNKMDPRTENKNLFSNKVKEILSYHKYKEVSVLSVKQKKKKVIKKLVKKKKLKRPVKKK